MATLFFVGLVSGLITAISPCVLPVLPVVLTSTIQDGAAHVVMSGKMGAAVVMGEEVPMPDGGAVMAIAEGDLSSVSEITVTEEPKGGSISPTGTVVARVAL